MKKERYLGSYPDVLTPEEAMKVLCIGRNKIYELLQSGRIKSLKIGKQYRIPKKSVQAFIDPCYNIDKDSDCPDNAGIEGV